MDKGEILVQSEPVYIAGRGWVILPIDDKGLELSDEFTIGSERFEAIRIERMLSLEGGVRHSSVIARKVET